MRAIAALAWMLMCSAALAQSGAGTQSTSGPGFGSNIGGGILATYTGPGDIVSGATVWVGLRAYSAAKAAALANAVQLTRASDSTTLNVTVLANGALNTSAAQAFCAATTCGVTTWYDQSGNGNNMVQVASLAPQIVFTGCSSGSDPCVTFNGTSQYTSATVPAGGQPQTYSIVYETAAVANSVMVSEYYTGNQPNLTRPATANVVDMYAGAHVTAAATDAAWHAVQAVYNGASSILNVDGTGATVNPGAGQAGQGCVELGTNLGGAGQCNTASGVYFQGSMAEFGKWPSGFSTANNTAVCHNQYQYWGTSTSC